YLFAKVVEHGSYSAAARALGLQTSKLSRRIADLERQLGVRLLQRTTRRVTVTEVGQTYYQHCAALEAEAIAAQEAIDRTRSAPQGNGAHVLPHQSHERWGGADHWEVSIGESLGARVHRHDESARRCRGRSVRSRGSCSALAARADQSRDE